MTAGQILVDNASKSDIIIELKVEWDKHRVANDRPPTDIVLFKVIHCQSPKLKSVIQLLKQCDNPMPPGRLNTVRLSSRDGTK